MVERGKEKTKKISHQRNQIKIKKMHMNESFYTSLYRHVSAFDSLFVCFIYFVIIVVDGIGF